MKCGDPSHDSRCTPERCAVRRDRGDGEGWRAEALNLGVNPDADDHRYWSAFDRAKGIVDSFRYHQPSAAQIERIARVREAHVACAKLILQNTPVGADQTVALRKLHESMMTANKAIACEA